MSNLREIKKRISSVSRSRQITRTMEMVSTAKIARALNREMRSEPYRQAITDVMLTVAADASSNSPLLKNPDTYERALLIVINSDRGLAGGFNTQVVRAAETRIEHYRRHGATEVELITCGRKATEHFKHYPNVVMSVVGESDNPTLQRAREIADYILQGFAEGRFGRVDIIYYHARNRVDQVLRQERILPLDPDVLAAPRGPRTDDAGGPKRIALHFSYSPSANQVLDQLIPSYVLTVVHQALIDSAAAEQGARRKAMHSATENAGNIIADLTRTYNHVRQASITTELNEIVGGAAALEDY
ncbi:ATP synthase F1 subunit gamma [Collinsella sp. zg1085]|uniref:ATP synthase F1 subunit gamma n=1 Tax=Collinsella sp. zg1085 TaxID=2844380 RepID=UPI001C0D6B6F|nr:ATP synthase F1 subunit gamma [Collinsella sp. zg1085]QWT17728.1 ATP synthase F1 subunit gamma [Collinsella sp. zg1085]